MVRVWQTKSPLFCLRYDPLIVFWRQNHITFIFIKTMSHDLLVQIYVYKLWYNNTFDTIFVVVSRHLNQFALNHLTLKTSLPSPFYWFKLSSVTCMIGISFSVWKLCSVLCDKTSKPFTALMWYCFLLYIFPKIQSDLFCFVCLFFFTVKYWRFFFLP